MRRVVAEELPGRVGFGRMGHCTDGVAQHRFNLGSGNAAMPQQCRPIFEATDNSRLDADLAAPAIEDGGHLVAEMAAHMVCRGRADLARGIGAGRHHRTVCRLEEFQRHRM